MALKDQIQSNVVNPTIHGMNMINTIGVVQDSDESNNTCTVQYIDKNGNKRNRENVIVRLYGAGTDWFPSKGETVIVEETEDTCVVIARHVGNYDMDVRSKMELKQDKYSDGGACNDPGGSIC